MTTGKHKTKEVMNYKVANYLKRKGFQTLYVRKNINEPNKHVFVFEKTLDLLSELKIAIQKYEGVTKWEQSTYSY